MRDLFLLAAQLVVTLAKLVRPGGVRSVIAESLLLKQQLIISRRCNRRAPPLTTIDRFVLGLTTLFVSPQRVAKLAAILKPATLLRFHKALVDRKYRRLFSSAGTPRKPGPKGPTEDLIRAIVELKSRNPGFGYQRIAQQLSHAFGVQIEKDVVRRVLLTHYRPYHPDRLGPSWLTFFAQAKDSLWSVDLFRCESILLRSHWVLVIIDVFTRRLTGFGVGGEYIDGLSVCRMFNQAIAGTTRPKRISTDHDPLFRFHRWLANLRILEVEEIKSVPYAPISHPFIERLIGTIRREYLDRTFFWNSVDLQRKLENFRAYYNDVRVHRSLNGTTPANRAGNPSSSTANLAHYAWARHCDGLFQTPVVA
jgi:transposase InsO family protein